MATIKSSFVKLNTKDILRGLAIAAGASATYLFTFMTAGTMPTMEILKSTAIVFVGAAGSYLVKNLLTNSSDEFLKPEQKQ